MLTLTVITAVKESKYFVFEQHFGRKNQTSHRRSQRGLGFRNSMHHFLSVRARHTEFASVPRICGIGAARLALFLARPVFEQHFGRKNQTSHRRNQRGLEFRNSMHHFLSVRASLGPRLGKLALEHVDRCRNSCILDDGGMMSGTWNFSHFFWTLNPKPFVA